MQKFFLDHFDDVLGSLREPLLLLDADLKVLKANRAFYLSFEVKQTEFSIFSADETAGVGVDAETPVSEDYTRASSKFTGTIDKVTIGLKK